MQQQSEAKSLRRWFPPAAPVCSTLTASAATTEMGRRDNETAPTWMLLPETQRVRLVATLGRMVQASRAREADDE